MKKVLAAVSGILGVLLVGNGIITLVNKGSRSISIIGGADGPTAVFLAGKVGTSVSAAVIIAGAVLLAICAACIIKIKKHK